MHFSISTTLMTLAAIGAASPTNPSPPSYECLSDAVAKKLVHDVVELFTLPNPQLAREVLTKDFHEYSDSANFLGPNPPPSGTASASSRKEFIQQQSGDTGSPTFTIIDYFHSCTKISFRWILNLEPEPVRGIDVLETVYVDGKWRVSVDYSEFNVGNFLKDFGYFCPDKCDNPSGSKRWASAFA